MKSLLLLALLANLVQTAPLGIAIVLISIAILANSFHRPNSVVPEFLIGVITPLAGVITPFALKAVVCAYLLLRQSRWKDIQWARPWMILTGIWTTTEFLFGFDGIEIYQILKLAGLSGALEALQVAPPLWLSTANQWVQWLLLFLLFGQWQRHRLHRYAVYKGILAGFLVAVICSVFYFSFSAEAWFPNQTAYWTALGRHSLTFTDPNAFGLAVVLLVALVWCYSRTGERWVVNIAGLLALGWVTAALWSGSRTFFVGLIVLFIGACSQWRRQRLIVASILLVLIAMIISIAPVSNLLGNWAEQSTQLPVTITRVVKTIAPEYWSEAFHSRLIFSEAAISMWRSAPLLGVGFARFRQSLIHLDLPTLGIWTDNANNFYLGILSETGLLGLLLLLSSLTWLQWRRNPADGAVPTAASTSIASIAVMLILGPHLDFIEVSILVALLSASIFSIKSRETNTFRPYVVGCVWQSPWLMASAWVIVGAVIAFHSSSFERGLYLPEQTGNSRFRWSRRVAQLFLPCQSGEAMLELQAIGKIEQPIQIKCSSDKEIQVQIKPGELHQSKWLCGHDVPAYFQFSSPRILCQLNLSNIWIPAVIGMGPDPRALGLQLRIADKSMEKK